MARWRTSVLLMLVLAALAVVTPAAAEPRIALVVANQAYVMPGAALTNTYQDGEVVKAALEKVGFKVWLVRDTPNEGRLLQVLGEHIKRLVEAGPNAVGFVYYTGHGAADGPNGSNYLLPTGMPSPDADELKLYAVPLDKITSTLSAIGKLNIVVFDACRNVPLKRSGKDFGFKGFAPVKEQSGLLLAYATEHGNVAVDQSLYARALAEEIQRPGQDASKAFRAVARRVSEETGGKQVPQILDARIHEFEFVAAAGPPPDIGDGKPAAARPPPTALPAIPAKEPAPAPRPQAPAQKPQREAAVIDTVQKTPNSDCNLEARPISIDAAGRASFALKSSCGAVSEVMVRYQGLSQRRRVAGDRVTVDLFGGPGPITFEQATGGSQSLVAQGLRGDDVLKVALVWNGPVNLDLHVLQDGARVGESNALSPRNPRSLAEAQTGQTGFISSFDDDALDGDHVEVYTFVKAINHRSGAVELRVDHASRGDMAAGEFCGSGARARIDFKILRYTAGRVEQHVRGVIPSAPCGTRLDERLRYQIVPKPIRFD